MVNIILTNQNLHAQVKHVNIDMLHRVCTIDHSDEMPLMSFLQTVDFEHPLLTEPFKSAPDYQFKFEYHTVDELFRSAILLYSTLLQVDNPKACHFRIKPSDRFQYHAVEKEIYLSIHPNKPAKKTIPIRQLEQVINQLNNEPFKFSENLIIDDSLTINDLPDSIDGDKLYQTDPAIIQLMQCPAKLNYLELRYVHPHIGLGVFSRKSIPMGEIISLYSGVKKQHDLSTYNYAFVKKNDCLNLYLDARQQGNILRFVNHAPNPPSPPHSAKRQTKFLHANVHSKVHTIQGIDVIIYSAIKDISPGEQLLVDYGSEYYPKNNYYRFKHNGRVSTPIQIYFKQFTRHQLTLMWCMSDQGIKDATIYLYLRMLLIIGSITLSIELLHFI